MKTVHVCVYNMHIPLAPPPRVSAAASSGLNELKEQTKARLKDALAARKVGRRVIGWLNPKMWGGGGGGGLVHVHVYTCKC